LAIKQPKNPNTDNMGSTMLPQAKMVFVQHCVPPDT
jgi:hypothetical protein